MTRQVCNDVHLVVTPLKLHHHGTAFLHKPNRVFQRLTRLGVAHEWHVRYQERTPQATCHRLRMIDNIIDRDRHRCVVSLNNHAQ